MAIRFLAAAALALVLTTGSAWADVDVVAALTREVTAALGTSVPASARVQVTLATRIDVPVDAVRDVTHDPRTGNVRAAVVIRGRTYEIEARAEVIVDVPVPNRRVVSGEVLREEDLADIAVPMKRLGETVVTDRKALIGFAAKRSLGPGRLIQASSIGTPVVVVRNRPVRLIYEDGTLRLTAQGRALSDAGVGERVRAMNNASGVVVAGIVAAPGVIAVAGTDSVDEGETRERK